MADVHSKKIRSYNMSRIKGRNTKPELMLRKILFQNGVKGYRVNAKLLGKPDIVFGTHRIAVFVDGCFWHKCPKCFNIPSNNRKFWLHKISGNTRRDKLVNKLLAKKGYRVIRIWEHEVRNDLNGCFQTLVGRLKSSKRRILS